MCLCVLFVLLAVLTPHSHQLLSLNSFFSFSFDLVSSFSSQLQLKAIHLHIRSLVSKIDLLRAWVTLYKPNITISETWPHSQITDNEIKIDNFVLYRADRPSRGVGVATYVAANLVSECVISNVEPVHFECLFN